MGTLKIFVLVLKSGDSVRGSSWSFICICGSRDHGSVLKTSLLQLDCLVCAVNTHLTVVLEHQLCP